MNLRRLSLCLALILPFTATLPAQQAVLGKRDVSMGKKLLKRTDKVIIAGFRVAFNLEGSASASTDSRLKNLGNTAASPSGIKTVHSDASVSLKVTLGGVGPEDFQRITDEAYADFKAQLAQAGVQVVGIEELKASKGWSELTFTPSTPEKPYVKDLSLGAGTSVVVYTPAELPLFLGHFDGGAIGPVTMNLGNWRALNQLSVEHKAVVIVPTIAVDFIKMKSSGHRKMLRDTAEVGADPQISLMTGLTMMSMFHAKIRLAGDAAIVQLSDGVVVPGEFGSLRQVSAIDNADINRVMTMLTGAVGTNSKRSTQMLKANPADYSRLSLDALRAFNRAAGAFIAAK